MSNSIRQHLAHWWLIVCAILLSYACQLQLADAQNCDADSQQCSVSWRTYQVSLEAAWAAYKPAKSEGSNAAAGDCSVFAAAMQQDLAPFGHPSDGRAGGGIAAAHIDAAAAKGGVLYQIISGRLYRSDAGGACAQFPARCAGVEHYLIAAAPSVSRNVEFVVNLADLPLLAAGADPPLPVLSFSKSRARHRDILYPAWSFSQGGPCLHPIYSEGIGDWNGTRLQLLAAAEAHPWANKTDVAFFRGSRTSSERDTVVLLSLAKPDLFDARYTKNQAYKSAMDTLNLDPAPYISLPDHCKYRYLINMRGVAASFRLRHILLCGSLVLHAGSDWEEFFYPALRPWIHYVPLAENLRDAEDKLLFLRANQRWAVRMATEGTNFVTNRLRHADVACYWVRLLRRLSRLVTYNVTPRPDMLPLGGS